MQRKLLRSERCFLHFGEASLRPQLNAGFGAKSFDRLNRSDRLHNLSLELCGSFHCRALVPFHRFVQQPQDPGQRRNKQE